ncbi:MAG: hypothetical protein PHR51_00100 [Patescibacteria group bacterium]|nr:hypothetical protein [Patescibacteria group bacterium]
MNKEKGPQFEGDYIFPETENQEPSAARPRKVAGLGGNEVEVDVENFDDVMPPLSVEPLVAPVNQGVSIQTAGSHEMSARTVELIEQVIATQDLGSSGVNHTLVDAMNNGEE